MSYVVPGLHHGDVDLRLPVRSGLALENFTVHHRVVLQHRGQGKCRRHFNVRRR